MRFRGERRVFADSFSAGVIVCFTQFIAQVVIYILGQPEATEKIVKSEET